MDRFELSENEKITTQAYVLDVKQSGTISADA